MRLRQLLLAALLSGWWLPAAAQQPPLQVSHPEEVTAGDPIGIQVLSWLEGTLSVSLNGIPLQTYPLAGGLAAFSVAPLGSEAADWLLEVEVRTDDGELHSYSGSVAVRADPRPVEELSIPASVLSLSTPEAREVEAAMVERVWSAPAPEPLWTEPFILPIEGSRPTSIYGDPRRYAPGGRVSFHEGTDMAAQQGTPVLATNSGRVVIAAEFPAYPIKGGLVIIDHGAQIMSYYLHLHRVHVQEGSEVSRGDLIGEVGTTGLSTGPHLHWEMRLGNQGTNPLTWVGKTVPH